LIDPAYQAVPPQAGSPFSPWDDSREAISMTIEHVRDRICWTQLGWLVLLVMSVCATGQPVLAQSTAGSGRDVDLQSRLGLTRIWHAVVPAPRTNQGNEPLKFLIPQDSQAAFFLTRESVTGETPVELPSSIEVIVTLDTGQGKEIVSSRERGVHGRVLGVAGALRLAEIRKELLEKRGMTVKESVEFVPSARVFFLSQAGYLQAMDAETGAVVWNRRIQVSAAPILGYDVSDEFVAVVNGSHVEVYDVESGAFIKKHGLSNLPAGPPVIAGGRILSAGTNGRIEILTPFRTNSFRSDMGGFHGRLAMALTELENAYVWAVRDQVYVSMKISPARPIFSIPTRQPLRIAPGGFGDMMVLVEPDGAVKCFSQSSGVSIWQEFAGSPVVQSPVFVRVPRKEKESQEVEPAERPADPADDDPFGAGEAADPFAPRPRSDDDPFAPRPAAQDDPFAPRPAAQDDPFAARDTQDPFATGQDPFAAGTDLRRRDTADADIDLDVPSIRVGPTVDVENLIGTSDQVSVLLVGELGDVVSLNLRTGKRMAGFRASGIRRILTITDQRIYAISQDDQLVALDLRSGVRLGTMAIPQDWEGVVNPLSDRVYLQSREGQIVCFRPTSSITPRYRQPAYLREPGETRQEGPAEPRRTERDDVFDPFGGDPFRGGGGADPFRGDDGNPFGN